MERADYERIASGYDASRTIPEDALQAWRDALSGYLPPRAPQPLLDLGCGTGLWSGMLHRWFGVDVVGVEPAAAMRARAPEKGVPGHTFFTGGAAEAIPLKDGSCSCAWLSTVVHHFEDHDVAARELRRVLVPGGLVLIRSGFPGRSDDFTMFRYWPGARSSLERFVSLERVEEAFAGAGFRREAVKLIPQPVALSLRDYAERAAVRADSVLSRMEDDAYERGMRALWAEAEAETEPAPVVESIDLVVLRLS